MRNWDSMSMYDWIEEAWTHSKKLSEHGQGRCCRFSWHGYVFSAFFLLPLEGQRCPLSLQFSWIQGVRFWEVHPGPQQRQEFSPGWLKHKCLKRSAWGNCCNNRIQISNSQHASTPPRRPTMYGKCKEIQEALHRLSLLQRLWSLTATTKYLPKW